MPNARKSFGMRPTIPHADTSQSPGWNLLGTRCIAAAGAAAVFLSFGAIVVQANDDSGIREFFRQNAQTRRVTSSQSLLPRAFYPSERRELRTRAVAYAPFAIFNAPQTLIIGGSNAKPAKPQTADKNLQKEKSLSPLPPGSEAISRATAYCVRTCDGYFFPIGHAAGSSHAALEAACGKVCPASATQVFTARAGSDGITDAAARNGAPYARLKTAFAYRKSFDPGCGCTANGTGMAAVLINDDRTLRAGDLVMTAKGLRAFQGAGGAKRYSAANFKALADSRLTAAERTAAERIDPMRRTASAPAPRRAASAAGVSGRHPAASESRELSSLTRLIHDKDGRAIRYVGSSQPMFTR